ncbi:hypothetical protein FSP39_015653, partial [Pinctada imbricata]
ILKIDFTTYVFLFRRFDFRPRTNSYCQAGVIPFCPTGRDTNTMPKFEATDQVEIYALKKPVWEFKFGDLLGKLHIMHDAIGILNLNTKQNYTMEWYELFQLFNCTFPHVLKNDSVVWCNQGATCIYDGIVDNLWSQNGTLIKVADLTGAQFNQFAEWVLWDNKTGIFYETWTVEKEPGGKMWFDSFDCASWVLRAFEELANVGARFDHTIQLNYTRIHLYSDTPVYLGNATQVFSNKTLATRVREFYREFQNYRSATLDIEHIIQGMIDVLMYHEFYLFYNFEYWYLPMKPPYLKLSYNKIPLPKPREKLYFKPGT